jgi:alternate signal-mediated exported protein
MKKVLKKKPIIFIALLFAVILIGGTIAYYYSNVVIPNEFQTMTYNVKIREDDFQGSFGPKKVFIVNQEATNTPVVLRVNYNEYWTDDDNKNINNLKSDGTNCVTKNWTSAFLNDFTFNSNDGWYYYKKILKPQSEVQLLESVTNNECMGKYHLDFNFEAIQADESAVYNIWSKSITINGDNVSWGF